MDETTTSEQTRVTELHKQADEDYARAQDARAWQTHRDDANVRDDLRSAA
ncbi:hypothetical protein [Streptomyces sp. NPDC013457]